MKQYHHISRAEFYERLRAEFSPRAPTPVHVDEIQARLGLVDYPVMYVGQQLYQLSIRVDGVRRSSPKMWELGPFEEIDVESYLSRLKEKWIDVAGRPVLLHEVFRDEQGRLWLELGPRPAGRPKKEEKT